MNSLVVLAHAGHHHLDESASVSRQPLVMIIALGTVIVVLVAIVVGVMWQQRRANGTAKPDHN
jgi:heme/copper-type cytochrome/quinol oxidase subunit 2